MTIVSDIDGVLASFESAWEPLLARLAGGSKLPENWKTDPSFPAIWDWDSAAYGKEITGAGWKEVATSTKFWTTLKPTAACAEACRTLNALAKKNDVFFLTSRPGVGVQNQTCAWLYEQGINYPNVIVVKNYSDKIPLLENLKASFFVDDKLETMQEWYTHCFKNRISTTQSYFGLIDAPYNREGRTINGMKVAADINVALRDAGF
jgi:uncharacterized HAD superfamily protein